jgi:hypothetical protein
VKTRRAVRGGLLLLVSVPFAAGLLGGCTPSGGTLYRLRMCETGGNYRMHTWVGGREYAGAYGFDVIYWRAQGHRPDPQYASPALQDAVELADIRMLGVRRSNPGCAARLGLW